MRPSIVAALTVSIVLQSLPLTNTLTRIAEAMCNPDAIQVAGRRPRAQTPNSDFTTQFAKSRRFEPANFEENNCGTVDLILAAVTFKAVQPAHVLIASGAAIREPVIFDRNFMMMSHQIPNTMSQYLAERSHLPSRLPLGLRNQR